MAFNGPSPDLRARRPNGPRGLMARRRSIRASHDCGEVGGAARAARRWAKRPFRIVRRPDERSAAQSSEDALSIDGHRASKAPVADHGDPTQPDRSPPAADWTGRTLAGAQRSFRSEPHKPRPFHQSLGRPGGHAPRVREPAVALRLDDGLEPRKSSWPAVRVRPAWWLARRNPAS